MSVIGLVLGASFGIANRSVRIGQNAQERTEALKIAESQLEIFKSEYFTNLDIQGRNDTRPFCLVTGGSSVVVVDNTESDCKDIDGNGQSGLYSVSIYPQILTHWLIKLEHMKLKLPDTAWGSS